jgi:AcrR family transcriptional regulator
VQKRGTQAENSGPLSLEGLRSDPTSLLYLNADDPLILKLEMLRLLEVGFEPVEIRRAFNLESEAHLHEMLAQVRAEGTSTLVSQWAGSAEKRPTGFWGLDTMGQICAAAIGVFYQRGYHGATLRDIAEVVGIRAASIYNYFPTKEALLHHVMMETLSKLRQQVDTTLAATPDDPTERIADFVMEHIRFHIEHAHEAAVADNELRALSADKRVSVVALRDSYEEILRDLLQQGVQKGAFAETHIKLTSLAILTMCTSVAVWYRPEGPMSKTDIATAYTRLVLQMIGAVEAQEAGVRET